MQGIHVTSEIGRLRAVCLHRPGDELLNLPPSDLDRLLFDDLPFLDVAQQEHDRFARLLRERGVEVLYLEDLVAEAFAAHPGARDEFLDEYLAEAGAKGVVAEAVRDYLSSIGDDLAFVRKTMAGIARREVDVPGASDSTLAALVGGRGDASGDLLVDPMPNLYFTRDPFACIGAGASLNRMYSVTRNRETIYGKYLFAYHPRFRSAPLWYRRDAPFHLEGGDVLVLSGSVLAVGVSQRTQAAAIDLLAQELFWGERESGISAILAFEIPSSRAFMHLDTVFTQVDVDAFTIHPGIVGSLRIFELSRGAAPGQVRVAELDEPPARVLARALGVDAVRLIPCGGGDPIAAAREQWNDGSNTLAVAPGTVCVYQRNKVTNETLYNAGLELVVLPSAELSRGRGGPRCMSMPLCRDDVA